MTTRLNPYYITIYAIVAEWQTRTFKGRVGDHTGSSPVCRTKNLIFIECLKRG